MLLWEHIAWMQAGNNVMSPLEERIRDQNLNSPPLTVNSPLCVQMLL
jgi:hypothetical protein